MKSPMTIYRGERTTGPGMEIVGTRVTVNGRRLKPYRSQRVINHSPGGFEWGYRGSGPAQLALALLLDATGDTRLSLIAYQWFKDAVVSQWEDRWAITVRQITEWLEQWKREHLRPIEIFPGGKSSAGAEGGAS